MSKRLRLGAWVVALVAALAMLVGGFSVAYAAGSDGPDHEKSIKDNNDGTYTVSLTVTGESEKVTPKANVIVIVDRSGSMAEESGPDQATYTPSNDNGNPRYGLIDGEYVRLTRQQYYGGYRYYYNGERYTGQRYIKTVNESRLDATQDAVNGLAEALLSYNGKDGAPDDTVQMALVSFATDARTDVNRTMSYSTFSNAVDDLNATGGTNWEAALQQANTINFGDDDPTYVIFFSDGSPTFHASDGGYDNWNGNYNVYGSGQEEEPNMERSYTQAVDDASTIANKVGTENFYTIFAYGTETGADYMTQLTSAAGAPAGNNYSASDSEALQQAFAAILEDIEKKGFGDVDVNDGTTNQVRASSGEMHELLEVDKSSYKYYRSGGDYGTMQEWTDAPEAKFEGGSVKWDLSEEGILENGVTYTVTFDCYPSQETYDTIAQLKNGDITYDSLDSEIKKYIVDNGGGSYSLRTNTNATLTYDDTRDGTDDKTIDYENPDPVKTDASTLKAIKEWEGGQADTDSVELTILMDDETFRTVTLTSPEWSTSSFISYGLIKDGKVLTGAEGHDFKFAELDSTHYHWELETPTVHPMIIDGTPTMLVMVDEDHPATGDTIEIDGKEYYIDSSVAGLTATNHRRSNLNLKKIVTGENAPEDAKFPFTLTVNNAMADDPESTNPDTDNFVWFSIFDTVAQETVTTEANVGGVAGGPNADGYYWAKSGAEITVDMQAGWNLRFTNLPSGTTYTFVEGTTPGFAFVKSELVAGKDDDFSAGQTTKGTIVDTKTSYQVEYTNEYQIVEFRVTKVWEDGNDQDGIRPNPEDFGNNNLALQPIEITGGPEPDEVIENSNNSYTYVWKNLPKYDEEGKVISYSAVEPADFVPEGYTCAQADQNMGNGDTITNVHTPAETEATVVKDWDDRDNVSGSRPGSITVKLFKKVGQAAEEAIKTVELTAEMNWTYTEDGLAQYENGDEISYYWEEVEDTLDTFYKMTGQVVSGDTTTITNTYEAEGEAVLEATKAIEGAEWPEGKTITFTLAGEGGTLSETKTVTLTEAGTATFGAITYSLDDMVDGDKPVKEKTFTYTITEDGFGDGWTADPEQITATVKVVDNGKGTLETTVTYDPADKTITNKYEAEGDATIEVTKALEGAEWPEGKTLTVTLAGADGAPMPETTEVKLTEEGTASFGPIAYDQTHVGKTFKYTVTEDGFGDGWTGTPAEITATVKVEDNGDGTLKTTVTYDPEDATFTNTYKAEGEAVLEATKAIEGADWPAGKSIVFTLAGEGGTLPETKTVTLTEAGTATFGAIKYTEADIDQEYEYTITENGFGDGWTADPEKITAKVKVEDNGDGTLKTTITYTPEDATITNKYAAEGEATIEVAKELKGADWPEGKTLTVTLAGADGAPMPETTTVTLTEAGKATFGPIAYDETHVGKTFKYTVTEDGFGDGWTGTPAEITAEVTVSDKGDGTLETSVKYTPEDATFTNTYKAEGEAVLEATKAIEGADWPAGKSIVFTLAGEGGTLPETKTVTLTEAGTATFGAIKYTEADIDQEYEYTITENGFGDGWTADPEKITAKVKVEDNGDGTLKTTITYTPEDATITNKYAAEGEAILQATKTISGADWPEGKSITFTLTGEGGTLPETTTQTLTSAGTVTFDAIKYTEADIDKEYQYTITEDGFGDGWTPSPEQITATVKVTDNGDGSLKTTVTYDPENKTINNKYEAEGEATLEVEKELVGREWKDGEEYTFTLYGPDGKELGTATATQNGSVSFETIKYDESDAGKTYKYTIKETSDLPDGVTKSADVEATVKVTDNGDGTLATEVTYTNNDKVINTYEAKPVKAQIEVEKKVDGFIEGTDVHGNTLDRTFTITMTGPKIDGELSTTITTKNGTGTATFPEIEYTFEDMVDDEGKQVTTKDFEYTVKETVETPAGWTYDSNEYTVTVTVEDDQNGKLVVTDITKVDESEDSPNVEIVNEYVEESTEVTLHVIKNIDDQSDSAQDATFTFQLLDADGATIDEKSVTTEGLTGAVDFDKLTFTKAGTYNYTIKETVESQEPGWTYDDHEYAVKIVVADDFSIAELVVTEKTVDGEAVSDDTINVTFTNVYKAEATKATLKVTKEVDDKSGSADPNKTFTFTLAGDKYMPATTTATIKAGETAEFGPIDYDKAGTFKYTITESDGGGAAWTYDTTEYPVTVEVVDENAKLVATVTYDGETTEVDGETILKVTNIYDPEDAKATPEARKLIKDLSKSAPDETFTFTLTPQGAPGETQTVTRENGGPFSFDEITFDMVGTYNYTIQETAGSTNGFTYDTAEHALTITVTDPGDGQLKAEIKYADANEDGELVITNIYEAEPTSLVLDVEKVISGPVDPKKDATFTFELTGDAEMTTSVTGEGTASFDEIKYTEAGTYYYTVTEVPGDSDDYIYDGTVYTVTVEVVDEGGKLVATPTISADGADVDSIVFDNPYVPEVGLKVTKTVVSKPANGSYYKEGETVKYKIVVTNTGECDLTDVKVDDELTGDHWVVKKLAAGASKNFTTSYKVTKDDVKAGSVLNVVTAEADNPVDPDKPLKDKDKVKVPTGDDKTPPEPPHRKVVPQTGDDTPTGAMALMTVFGAAALTAGTVLKRKRK